MFKRIGFFAYGSFSYLIFLATFLYAVGFIGNFGVPTTLDGPARGPLLVALLIDVGLLTLFATQHSIMARKWFKEWWTRFVPKPLERSTYVLFSSLALILLFWLWRPLGGVVWSIEDPIGRLVLRVLFAFGWLTVLVSTFLINHFDLFGMRQVWLYLRGRRLHDIKVWDSRSIPAGSSPALRRLAVCFLEYTDDDARSLALLNRNDCLHPPGDPIRGARPGSRAWRHISVLPAISADANSLHPTQSQCESAEHVSMRAQ